MSNVTDQQLNDAITLLATYVADRLPDGYGVSVLFEKDCVSIELQDDVYDEVEFDGEECDFRCAVEAAIEDAQAEWRDAGGAE